MTELGAQTTDDLAELFDRVRRHVLGAPNDTCRAASDLADLLDCMDTRLAAVRIAVMTAQLAHWSGGAPAHDPSAATAAGVDGPLRAAAHLLHTWAGRRSIAALVDAEPRLMVYRTWLAGDDGLSVNACGDSRLVQARAVARHIRADLTSTVVELASAVVEVKAAALQTAGTVDLLVAHLLRREGLVELPAVTSYLPSTRLWSDSAAGSCRRVPTVERVSALRPAIAGWDGFATMLPSAVTLDLAPRAGKRAVAACVPLANGRSVIVATSDGSPDSTASVLHEIAHAFLYWTVRAVPELARPARALDEQIALDVELRLHAEWSRGLPPRDHAAHVAAVQHRWTLMIEDNSRRLEREMRLLRHLEAGQSEAAHRLLLDEVPEFELRLNPHLTDEELAPARYVAGAVRALQDWQTEELFDPWSRTVDNAERSVHPGTVSDGWLRFLGDLGACGKEYG